MRYNNLTKKYLILSFIVSFCIFTSPLALLTKGHFYYLIVIFIPIAFVVISLFYNKLKIHISFLVLIIVVIGIIIYSLLSNVDNYRGAFYGVLAIFNLLMAHWLVNQPTFLLYKVSLASLLFFYIFFILSGIKYGFSPIDLENFFLNSSRNMVSASVLILQIMYSVIYYRVNKKLPLLTPIITLLICILAYGRSGIFLSSAVLLYSIYKNYSIVALIKYSSIILIIPIISLNILDIGIESIFSAIVEKTNLSSGLKSSRKDMIYDYIKSMNLESFIFGYDLSKIPSIAFYNNNPHNSYILNHSRYGLLYFIFILYLFFLVLYEWVKEPGKSVYVILLLILLIRAAIDSMALFGFYDFVYFILFYFIVSSKANQ